MFCPSINVLWPTLTPATSVIAFNGPGGRTPTSIPRSRIRGRVLVWLKPEKLPDRSRANPRMKPSLTVTEICPPEFERSLSQARVGNRITLALFKTSLETYSIIGDRESHPPASRRHSMRRSTMTVTRTAGGDAPRRFSPHLAAHQTYCSGRHSDTVRSTGNPSSMLAVHCRGTQRL